MVSEVCCMVDGGGGGCDGVGYGIDMVSCLRLSR